jgi:hypothetical protein
MISMRWSRHSKEYGFYKKALSIDVTPCVKSFSPTLEDRQAIVAPNPGPHQKYRLEEGYNLSFVNVGNFDGKWSLPLDARRGGIDQTSSACGLAQIDTLLNDQHLGLETSLVVLNADNGYANVPFLQPLYEQHDNLVVIARLKKGSKTYTKVGLPATGGYHRQFYGEVHYNILASDIKKRKKCGKGDETYSVARTSISEAGADETLRFERKMGRSKRKVDVLVERFQDRLLKSKGGLIMKDKPVDIIRIQYLDPENQQGIYRHEMYLIISGERRGEVSSKEVQQSYVSRSDLEAFFRVGKQRMLLNNFQTCNLLHLDNYLLLVQLASWMSYPTAEEATRCINPWERYAQKEECVPPQRLSMAQSIRAAAAYYATLDLRHLSPPQRTGGTGRAKGTKVSRRKRHRRVRKRPVKG